MKRLFKTYSHTATTVGMLLLFGSVFALSALWKPAVYICVGVVLVALLVGDIKRDRRDARR